MVNYDPSAQADTLRWLEEEQRINKAAGFKAQQQLEQFQNTLWTQSEGIKSLEDAISGFGDRLGQMSRLMEEVLQLREGLARLEVTRADDLVRLIEVERLRKAEEDRDRQERNITQRLQEDMGKDVQSMGARTHLLEEIHRRAQDALQELKQRLEDQGQRDDALEGRLALAHESLRHREQDVHRLEEEQNAIRTEGEAAQGRIRALAEQVKVIQDEGNLQRLEEKLRQEFSERMEVARVERVRLERNLTEVTGTQERHSATLEEAQLRLSQIEGRTQTISDQLSELRDGLWQLRDEISEHFSQLTEREEQHKRRQIAEFEQYILQMKAQLGRNLKL